jgi:NAD(P)-dependent dehydrogenase (short-subunit alcohol dehydrogenase family)
MTETALIVGAGSGLSASFARCLASENIAVALAARSPEKLKGLAEEIGAQCFACDCSNPDDVENLYDWFDHEYGAPSVVLFNASGRVRGPVEGLDPIAVREAIMTACYGGFLVAQGAAIRMLKAGQGAILLTGASASVKGYPNSSAFAMGKFGLRGLAQSMARELAPKNIHVAHFIIDGGISKGADDPRAQGRGEDALLDPNAIAESYYQVFRQHRSAWTWEMELRPWVETF